jgi:hypothetical protein
MRRSTSGRRLNRHATKDDQIVPVVMTKAAQSGGQELLIYPAETEQKT